MGEKFCMSYSCGKDSTLALHRMIEKGHEPVALIVNVNEQLDRSWFHGVNNSLLNQISESLGIKVVKAMSKGDDYEENFIKAMNVCKDMGAVTCCFGDIDIEGHREWSERICGISGLEPKLPLWHEDRHDITMEFINKGFKAVIKTVSKKHGLPKELLGQDLSKETVDSIVQLGADSCGENGEYHTMAYDGPIFSFPVKYKQLGIYESEYSYSLNIDGE